MILIYVQTGGGGELSACCQNSYAINSKCIKIFGFGHRNAINEINQPLYN